MIKAPKAILIDLDDTIIASEQGVDSDACWSKSIRSIMPELDVLLAEQFLACIKERAAWYWSDAERHRIGRLDLGKTRQDFILSSMERLAIEDIGLAGAIAAMYGEERDLAVRIFPDAVETIQYFKSRGLKLAMLTNGNAVAQWSKIRRFELAELFDFVLVEGDLGFGKPDDQIYYHALRLLDVAAEETWMVGDNYEWEVAAPQRLGIKGIWIDHKRNGIPAGATAQPFMTIESLCDLRNMIEQAEG